MATLSRLQALPLHVTQLIVDHVVCNSRLELDGIDNISPVHGRLLLPLLGTCHSFRAAAVFRYSDICTIKLLPTSDEDSGFLSYWSVNYPGSAFPTHLYARELNIHVDIVDIRRGTALEELLRKPFGGLTFPKIRLLSVMLLPLTTRHHPADQLAGPQTVESNIREFVRHVKHIVPLMNKVRVRLASCPAHSPKFADHHVGSLVRQLCQLSDDVEHSLYYEALPIEMQPTGITKLLFYNQNMSGGSSNVLVMQLARRNAASLRSLTISFTQLASISPLIERTDGGHVQYPCLHSLGLGDTDPASVPQRSSFPNVVPFPNLHHLTIEARYMFGDDTPFRGNACSLEYLSLNLSAQMIAILHEHKVFATSSHPKLRYVKLGQRSSGEQSIFSTEVEFMRYLLTIGPKAPVREVINVIHSVDFASFVPAFSDYGCIQVLVLQFSPVPFWDLIALIKALPLLTDLHTSSSTVYPKIRDLDNRRLPTYMRENYAPIGVNLLLWRVGVDHSSKLRIVAKYALLLAMACPNLGYAAVSPECRELFMAHMEELICTVGFGPYEERLRRLLFGGWKNKFPGVRMAEENRTMSIWSPF